MLNIGERLNEIVRFNEREKGENEEKYIIPGTRYTVLIANTENCCFKSQTMANLDPSCGLLSREKITKRESLEAHPPRPHAAGTVENTQQ